MEFFIRYYNYNTGKAWYSADTCFSSLADFVILEPVITFFLMAFSAEKSIFGLSSNFKDRYVQDYGKLEKLVGHLRGLGLSVVLTSGTYDMVHIGHARYLETAKSYGDVLVVGVDSDEKVKARKGPDRPVVPEAERMEMVAHLRSVDIVVKKPLKVEKWALIKAVRPDTLIVTETSYDKKQLAELKKLCGKVVVLPRQATTTTSAKIRLLQIGTAKHLGMELTPRLIRTIEEVLEEVKGK
jgi:D-beta-D-heptose 7-phosphate kinase/D-beta-D-heptose 1-phosphate adenosyltransferase